MPGALEPHPVDRLRVAVGHPPGQRAREVFLLESRLSPPRSEEFTESTYLRLLAPLVPGPGSVVTVRTSRTRQSLGDGGALAEVAVWLVRSPGTETVTEVFRSLAELTGVGERRRLDHDQAVREGRRWVRHLFPATLGDRLSVSDAEHRAETGAWSVGLAAADLTRFQVMLGFVDGWTGTTWLRRTPGTEVVDSVGTEA